MEAAMEDIEIESETFLHDRRDGDFSDDTFAGILSGFFSNGAADDHHLHVCTAIDSIFQELKQQNTPFKPLDCLEAACSTLHCLLVVSETTETPGHILDALVTLVNTVISEFRYSDYGVMSMNFDFLSDVLIRVLRFRSIGPNGIVPGLECVFFLLTPVRKNVVWDNVAPLYDVLLSYITDCREKVRKKSHACLQDILTIYNMHPLHNPLFVSASESLTKVFEGFVLLAGGSNKNASDGPKGPQEVLYVLDVLKYCLTYMPPEYSTRILECFKTLLELRQPIVTRTIMDALKEIFLNPPEELSSEPLLDLLCFLVTFVSTNELDSKTCTARLLHSGMKYVYSFDKEMCFTKLPIVFAALNDILASGPKETSVAAMQTYKSLIYECIDEYLIERDRHHVLANEDIDRKQMMPTITEKISVTVGSLLDYHYYNVWDMSFQVVTAMFNKLGQSSSYFLNGALKSLADIVKDFPYHKQLHECLGSALRAMGPETFFNFLPLEANLWLIPILKKYIIGAQLSYFTESILSLVAVMKQKSKTLDHEGRIDQDKSPDKIVLSLWSLLPSFCNYPKDTAKSFKHLEKALSSALRDEPDVRGIVCSSLQKLIQQNKSIVRATNEISMTDISIYENPTITCYNSQVRDDNLSVLRSSAPALFSVLLEVFLKSSKDRIGRLQETIGELASISEKQGVRSFFYKIMKKLQISNSMQVDGSSEENLLPSERVAQLLDLAGSLLPGLETTEVDILFCLIKSGLEVTKGVVQKKAYKVLSMMLKHSDEFIGRKLEELLRLMIKVLPSCHLSAKRYRLESLYFLVVYVSKDSSEENQHEFFTSFLPESILALKETNTRARDRGYDIILRIGHSCLDRKKSGRKEKLRQFFYMIAGGLAGETPHMISASIMGLACLCYEFRNLVPTVYNIVPSIYLLLQRENTEIIKASLGLLHVLIEKSESKSLGTHLRGLVEGLLNWHGSGKTTKVKLLLEMLVNKCGFGAVKGVMPKEHMKLLTNIRKIKERRGRKPASRSMESRSQMSKATSSRQSRWNHAQMFSDFGDGETMNCDTDDMNANTFSSQMKTSMPKSRAASLRSRRKHKSTKSSSLQEDLFDPAVDEPLDLLDRERTRSSLRSSNHHNHEQKSVVFNDELEIVDVDGRMVIRESEKKSKTKKRQLSEAEGNGDGKSGEVSSSMNSRKEQKRMKTSESGWWWAYTGKDEYERKEDKMEPYAYWPLDRKMLSGRPEHKAAARKGMASVVNLTKKLQGTSISDAIDRKI